MHMAAFHAIGILKTVILAAAVGICLACAGTWLLWSLRIGIGTVAPLLVPTMLLVVSYSAVAIVGFRNREVSTSTFAVAYLIGLLVSLLIGGIWSEMIHCSFDRAGCMNL